MKFIKNLILVIIAISFGLSSINCESSSTDPKENIPANVPAEVVGNWEASGYIISNNANPTDFVELISEGYNLYLSIQSNGAYSSTLTYPNEPDNTETGTATFINNTVTIDPSDDDPFTMGYQVTADSILTFIDANSTFDFDDDGMDEAATETIILVKQ
jgi:hypothetical protein